MSSIGAAATWFAAGCGPLHPASGHPGECALCAGIDRLRGSCRVKPSARRNRWKPSDRREAPHHRPRGESLFLQLVEEQRCIAGRHRIRGWNAAAGEKRPDTFRDRAGTTQSCSVTRSSRAGDDADTRRSGVSSTVRFLADHPSVRPVRPEPGGPFWGGRRRRGLGRGGILHARMIDPDQHVEKAALDLCEIAQRQRTLIQFPLVQPPLHQLVDGIARGAAASVLRSCALRPRPHRPAS